MKRIDPTIGSAEVYRFAPGDAVQDINTGEYGTVLDIKTGGTTAAGVTTAVVLLYLHRREIKKEYDIIWDTNSGLVKVLSATKPVAGSQLIKNSKRVEDIIRGFGADSKAQAKRTILDRANAVLGTDFGMNRPQRPVDKPVVVSEVITNTQTSSGVTLTKEEKELIQKNKLAIKTAIETARLKSAGFTEEQVKGVAGKDLLSLLKNSDNLRSKGNFDSNLAKSLDNIDAFSNLISLDREKDLSDFLVTGKLSPRLESQIGDINQSLFGLNIGVNNATFSGSNSRFYNLRRRLDKVNIQLSGETLSPRLTGRLNKYKALLTSELGKLSPDANNISNYSYFVGNQVLDGYETLGVNPRDLRSAIENRSLNENQKRVISKLLERQFVGRAKSSDAFLSGLKPSSMPGLRGLQSVRGALESSFGLGTFIPYRQLKSSSLEEIATHVISNKKFNPFSVIVSRLYDTQEENQALNGYGIQETTTDRILRGLRPELQGDELSAFVNSNPLTDEGFGAITSIVDRRDAFSDLSLNIRGDKRARRVRPSIIEGILKNIGNGQYDDNFMSMHFKDSWEGVLSLEEELAALKKKGASKVKIKALESRIKKLKSTRVLFQLQGFNEYPDKLIGKAIIDDEGRTVIVTTARPSRDGVIVGTELPKLRQGKFTPLWGDIPSPNITSPEAAALESLPAPASTLTIVNDLGFRVERTAGGLRTSLSPGRSSTVSGEELLDYLGHTTKGTGFYRFQERLKTLSRYSDLIPENKEMDDVVSSLYLEYREALRTIKASGPMTLSKVEHQAMNEAFNRYTAILKKENVVRKPNLSLGVGSIDESILQGQLHIDSLKITSAGAKTTGRSPITFNKEHLDKILSEGISTYNQIVKVPLDSTDATFKLDADYIAKEIVDYKRLLALDKEVRSLTPIPEPQYGVGLERVRLNRIIRNSNEDISMLNVQLSNFKSKKSRAYNNILSKIKTLEGNIEAAKAKLENLEVINTNLILEDENKKFIHSATQNKVPEKNNIIHRVEKAFTPYVENELDSLLDTTQTVSQYLDTKSFYTKRLTGLALKKIELDNVSKRLNIITSRRNKLRGMSVSGDESSTNTLLTEIEGLNEEFNRLERRHTSLNKGIKNSYQILLTGKSPLSPGLTQSARMLLAGRGGEMADESIQLYNLTKGEQTISPIVMSLLRQRVAVMREAKREDYSSLRIQVDNNNHLYSEFLVNRDTYRLTLNPHLDSAEAQISDINGLGISFGPYGQEHFGRKEIRLEDAKRMPFNYNYKNASLDSIVELPFFKVNKGKGNYITHTGLDSVEDARGMVGRALKMFDSKGNLSDNVLAMDVETLSYEETKRIGYIYGGKGAKSFTGYTREFIKSLDRDSYLEGFKNKLDIVGPGRYEFLKEKVLKAAKEKVIEAGIGQTNTDYLHSTDIMGKLLSSVMSEVPKDTSPDDVTALTSVAMRRIRKLITLKSGKRFKHSSALLREFNSNILSDIDSDTIIYNQNVKFDVDTMVDELHNHFILDSKLTKDKQKHVDMLLLAKIHEPGLTSYTQNSILGRMYPGYVEQHLGEADTKHALLGAREFVQGIKDSKLTPEQLIDGSNFQSKGLIYDSSNKIAYKIFGAVDSSTAEGLEYHSGRTASNNNLHLVIEESDYGTGLGGGKKLMPLMDFYGLPEVLEKGSINAEEKVKLRIEDRAGDILRNIITKKGKDTSTKFDELVGFNNLMEDFSLSEDKHGLGVGLSRRYSQLEALAESATTDNDKALFRNRASILRPYSNNPLDVAAHRALRDFHSDLKDIHLPNVKELLRVPNLDNEAQNSIVTDYFQGIFNPDDDDTPRKVIDTDSGPKSIVDYWSRVDPSRSNDIKEAILEKYSPKPVNGRMVEQLVTAVNKQLSIDLQAKAQQNELNRQGARDSFYTSLTDSNLSKEELLEQEDKFLRSETASFIESVKNGKYDPSHILTSPILSAEYTEDKVEELERLSQLAAKEVKNVKPVTLGNTLNSVGEGLTKFFGSGGVKMGIAAGAVAASSFLAYKALSRPDLGQEARAEEERTVPLKGIDTIVEDDHTVEKKLREKRNLYIRATGTSDGPVDSRVLNQVVAETVSPYIKVEKADARVKDNREKIQGNWLNRADFSSFKV